MAMLILLVLIAVLALDFIFTGGKAIKAIGDAVKNIFSKFKGN